MKRSVALLMMLTAVSCGKTPVQRGSELFRAAADKLGEAQVADLEIKSAAIYGQYVKEAGSREALAHKFGTELLAHYAPALSVTKDQEKEFKAGKFKDVEGREKVNALINQYVSGKASVTPVGRLAVVKTQSGAEWNSGLQLELTRRILEFEIGAR